MPRTFDSQRLRIQRQAEQRLDAEHAALARAISGLVLRSATTRNAEGAPIIPLSRTVRDSLKVSIWEQVLKPYYIGSGIEPLRGPQPQSPYARLVVQGITAVTRVQVARQVAIVTRLLSNRAPDVLQWLTGPRPLRVNELRATYDPFHQFVDPNGYRLSDRIWRTSIDVRSRVDRLLDYHIGRGTSAVEIADLLEPFLTRGGLRQRTVTPYGTEGSYAARRLARTEITAASGRATVNSSIANPFVTGVRWVLSRSHRDIDECDFNANGGENGDGVYPPEAVPPYPNHPHCVTPGQMVQTSRGAIPIEQVSKGDKVLTHKGHYRRVLAAWATPHDGAVYEFMTERGTFELTGNHPVLTRRGWVNAECVQLGDQILYANINTAANGCAIVAEGAPTERSQARIPQGVTGRVSFVPTAPVTFDGDLVIGDGEIDHVGQDANLLFGGYAMSDQAISHENFDIGSGYGPMVALRGTEPLRSVAILHAEGFSAELTEDKDRILQREFGRELVQLGQTRIVPLLGAADFASNFRAFGGVKISRDIAPRHGATHRHAGDLATRAVVLLPSEARCLLDSSERQTNHPHKFPEHTKGNRQFFAEGGRTEPLIDVKVGENGAQVAARLGFDASGVPVNDSQAMQFDVVDIRCFEDFPADGASEIEAHDNLLSLSPDDSVGRESGNSLVNGVISPVQALPNYSAVRDIQQRHYVGPVYNMEVADDHAYTVNGASVHNCLCTLAPVATGSVTDLIDELRVDIAASRNALQGILGTDWLAQAILAGFLDEALARTRAVGSEEFA